MNIFDLAEITKTEIRATWPTINGKWTFNLTGIEIKEGGVLLSPCGYGTSPLEASTDYCTQIRGKTIVKNACGPNRQEFDVPKKLALYWPNLSKTNEVNHG